MESDIDEIDQLAADTKALTEEMQAESIKAANEPSGVTREYLADSVMAFIAESNKMQQETRNILTSIQEAPKQIRSDLMSTHTSILQPASASIEAASQDMALAVNSSLKKLEDQKLEYQQAIAKLRAREARHFLWLAVGTAIAVGVLFLFAYFFLKPKVDEFKAYAQDHRALEASSVFGARVVESNGDRFVLFDDGVTVQSNCSSRPNCISVETK